MQWQQQQLRHLITALCSSPSPLLPPLLPQSPPLLSPPLRFALHQFLSAPVSLLGRFGGCHPGRSPLAIYLHSAKIILPSFPSPPRIHHHAPSPSPPPSRPAGRLFAFRVHHLVLIAKRRVHPSSRLMFRTVCLHACSIRRCVFQQCSIRLSTGTNLTSTTPGSKPFCCSPNPRGLSTRCCGCCS